MTDAPNALPPGWYPDQDDSSKLRYWDGERWSEGGAAPEPSKPKTFKRTWLIGAGTVGAVAIGAAIAIPFLLPTPLERAAEACSGTRPYDDSELVAELGGDSPEERESDVQRHLEDMFEGVVTVEDDGNTLIVSTKPEDEDVLGLSSLALDCIYGELDTPTSVTELIGATRALDGRQQGEWGKYGASWGYHPDSGMNLIISSR